MSSEKGFLPGVDLWNPLVKYEHSRDSTEHRDPQEEDNQLPRSDAQLGAIESPEVQPCTDVDKAGTVEHQVDDGRERLFLGLLLEFSVPGYRATCSIRKKLAQIYDDQISFWHTCSKRSEKIVHSQGTRNSSSEKRQGEILYDERMVIRQTSIVGEGQKFAKRVPYRTLRNKHELYNR